METKRLPGLDILRSVAVLWVVVFHFQTVNQGFAGYLGQTGFLGVDLFFVLSGYLIGNQIFSTLLCKEFNLINFYQRRFLRTLPNYFLVLALYFLIPVFRERELLTPLWKFLTFTQNFNLYFGAFSHAWSLCIEEQFYLVLPLIVLLMFGRVGIKSSVALILGVLLGGILARAYLLRLSEGASDPMEQYYRLIYYPTWGRLDGLLMGVALGALKNFCPLIWQSLVRRGNLFLVLGLGVCAIALILFQDRLSLWTTALGFPLVSLGFSFLVLAAVSPKSFMARAKIPGAEILATLSFALYLLHKPIFHLTSLWMPQLSVPALFILGVTLSLIASSALYLCIERPFLRLRDRLSY